LVNVGVQKRKTRKPATRGHQTSDQNIQIFTSKFQRVMTDFGGSGHGGAVAECELNIPIKITSGSATLTSSDLNELGCSASTTKHLNERIESNDSGFSSRSSQSAGSSVAESKPPKSTPNTNSAEKSNSKSKIRKKESPITQKRHRRSSSSRHFVRSLIAAVTNGFSNCSRKKNQNTGTQNGSDHRRHSDSEEDSAQDSFGNNFKSNMKIRNISRDGAGFVIGSEATSTGYVSDSVDGYDKCKGLESEHGRSDQDHSDRCDHHDRSSHDHDRSVGVGHPESFCSLHSRDNISKQVLMSEKNDYSKCNLLETSVTAAISAKLNLNYTDKEEKVVDGKQAQAADPVKQSGPVEEENKKEKKGDKVKTTEYVYVAEDDTEDDSCESGNESEHDEEEPTGSQTGSQTGNTNSNSDSDISDYETNDSSSSYLDLETTQDIKNSKLDVIMEEYDEEILSPDDFGAEYPPDMNLKTQTQNSEKIAEDGSQKLKKKPTIKRKKSTKSGSGSTIRRRNSKAEEDLKNGMKAKLTSLRNDLKLKEEDAISRTNSLKDMILQFETAVAALEIGEGQVSDSDSDSESKLHQQLGVKAIAQKIQEQNAHANEFECAQMPPSQILKLKQALDLEDEKLSKPVPISRRSESKVKLIAKQLAEAEKRRLQMEKLARSQMMKSPKDIKKAASTSFINELLEMARAESEDKLNEISKKEEPHDFKQSLLAARKKITHREQQAEKSSGTPTQNGEKKSEPSGQKTKPSRIENRTKSVSSVSSIEAQNGVEEIDPFVKEVLTSKTVPEPVKQKIRIECWSLFNDPRTPKGVKQCILATMLSKVQNE
jgi:hypothetical protein